MPVPHFTHLKTVLHFVQGHLLIASISSSTPTLIVGNRSGFLATISTILCQCSSLHFGCECLLGPWAPMTISLHVGSGLPSPETTHKRRTPAYETGRPSIPLIVQLLFFRLLKLLVPGQGYGPDPIQLTINSPVVPGEPSGSEEPYGHSNTKPVHQAEYRLHDSSGPAHRWSQKKNGHEDQLPVLREERLDLVQFTSFHKGK